VCVCVEFQVFINIIHEVMDAVLIYFVLIKYYQYIVNIPFIVCYFLISKQCFTYFSSKYCGYISASMPEMGVP